MAGKQQSSAPAVTPKAPEKDKGKQDEVQSNTDQATKLVGAPNGSTPPTAPTAQQQQAAKDLGEVKKVDNAFAANAGALLEGMVPRVGDEASAKLDIKIPINPAMGVTLSFSTKVSHGDKGYKLNTNVGVGFRGEVDAKIAKVFAEAKVSGYLEAQGGTVAEGFKLMILAMRQAIAGVNTDVADWMFDGGEMKGIIRGMGKDDYVKTGLQVSGKAGTMSGDKERFAVGASADFSNKFTRDGSSDNLKTTKSRDISVDLTVPTELGTWKGALKGTWEDGKFKKVGLSGEGEFSSKIEKLGDPDFVKQYAISFASSMADMIAVASGKLEKDRDIGLVLARHVKNASATGLMLDAGAVAALKKAGATKVASNMKLVAKASAEYDVAKGPKFTLEFAKKSGFSLNAGSVVKVALENVSSIFKIEV